MIVLYNLFAVTVAYNTISTWADSTRVQTVIYNKFYSKQGWHMCHEVYHAPHINLCMP